MNTAQLEAMQAGRERQLAYLHEKHTAQAAAYKSWLSAESAAFENRRYWAEMCSRDSVEFFEADVAWHNILSQMPAAPPPGAWWD